MQLFYLESITAGADCAFLRVGGEVDVYTAPQLRQSIVDLLSNGARHVIADLREVDFLGASFPEAVAADQHWQAALACEDLSVEEWSCKHGLL